MARALGPVVAADWALGQGDAGDWALGPLGALEPGW
jgi:hypothetical protein